MEAGLETPNRSEIERKEIEEQGSIGFGGERNHLAPRLICGLFVDNLQVGGFSTKAGTVVNNLAIDLASREVNEAQCSASVR